MPRESDRKPSALLALALAAFLLLTSTCQASVPSPPKITLTQIPTLPQPTASPSPVPPTSTPPPPTPIPFEQLLTPTTTEVEVDYVGFKASDSVTLIGKLFGAGELAVILAHQGVLGANQRDWEPFARLLAGRGFAVFTFDFRSFGLSKGMISTQYYNIRDMRAAIQVLHERGYRRIACIGASMGGTACMKAATEYDLAGLVVVASPMTTGEPTNVTAADLAEMRMPKLFLCAENDRYEGLTATLVDIYELSPEPKRLRLFPGDAHGTEMFGQPYRDEFSAEMLSFLESLR